MLWNDRKLEHLPLLIDAIKTENQSQIEKWGTQSHRPTDWISILTEELGETAKAVNDYYWRKGPLTEILKESVQVATLAMKIVEMCFCAIEEG